MDDGSFDVENLLKLGNSYSEVRGQVDNNNQQYGGFGGDSFLEQEIPILSNQNSINLGYNQSNSNNNGNNNTGIQNNNIGDDQNNMNQILLNNNDTNSNIREQTQSYNNNNYNNNNASYFEQNGNQINQNNNGINGFNENLPLNLNRKVSNILELHAMEQTQQLSNQKSQQNMLNNNSKENHIHNNLQQQQNTKIEEEKIQQQLLYNQTQQKINNTLVSIQKEGFEFVKNSGNFENNIKGIQNEEIQQNIKEKVVDFLTESQDILQAVLDKNLKKELQIGLNKKINDQQTIRFAFNMQNSFNQTWPYIFNASYQVAFNSISGRKCPLPHVKTGEDEQLNLESQTSFNVETDLLQILPDKNTNVFLTTSLNNERQLPIPFIDFVNDETIIMDINRLKQFRVDQITTIYMIVTKKLCEESDLYQIVITPQGKEQGLQRPEFQIDGSQRRQESWRHQLEHRGPIQQGEVEDISDYNKEFAEFFE